MSFIIFLKQLLKDSVSAFPASYSPLGLQEPVVSSYPMQAGWGRLRPQTVAISFISKGISQRSQGFVLNLLHNQALMQAHNCFKALRGHQSSSAARIIQQSLDHIFQTGRGGIVKTKAGETTVCPWRKAMPGAARIPHTLTGKETSQRIVLMQQDFHLQGNVFEMHGMQL